MIESAMGVSTTPLDLFAENGAGNHGSRHTGEAAWTEIASMLRNQSTFLETADWTFLSSKGVAVPQNPDIGGPLLARRIAARARHGG